MLRLSRVELPGLIRQDLAGAKVHQTRFDPSLFTWHAHGVSSGVNLRTNSTKVGGETKIDS
jgi:hypothetical protein